MASQPTQALIPPVYSNYLEQTNFYISSHPSQTNGYDWSVETEEQSNHYVFHSTAARSGPPEGTDDDPLRPPFMTQSTVPLAQAPSSQLSEMDAITALDGLMAPPSTIVPPSNSMPAPSAPAFPNTLQRAAKSRRTRGNGLDWDRYQEAIRQLYMVEEKSLKDTMEAMAQEYGFHASEKLYKEKLKEWGWIKNLSATNALWMLRKANERMLDEEKETVFEIGGRVWNIERVRKSARRSGWQPSMELSAVNTPTPAGIAYDTPSNVTDHPSPMFVSPIHNQKDGLPGAARWTPAPETPRHGNQHPLRLTWNGCTKEEATRLFNEGQERDHLGDFEGAEKRFRDTLATFQHLLSPTHEHTSAVAYTLASFYARRDRMEDANAVLEWMNEKHSECLEAGSDLMIQHGLRVVDLLNSWLRPQDALAFLERLRDFVWQWEAPLADPENASHGHSAGNIFDRYQSTTASTFMFQPLQSSNSTTDIGVTQSSLMSRRLRSVEMHVRAGDASIEPILHSLIAQCEYDPSNFAVQSLHARANLIDLHRRLGRPASAAEELSKVEVPFLTAWNRDQKINKQLVDVSFNLGTTFLKLEQFQQAEDMFRIIQDRTVDAYGPDDNRTICLLIRIGLVYQNDNRWIDAEPRFEQALAASMTANGLEDAMTKSLEEALENRRYSFIEAQPGDFRTYFGAQGILLRPTMSMCF